jgi:hypothetical protein
LVAGLFKWAKKAGMVKVDPTAGVESAGTRVAQQQVGNFGGIPGETDLLLRNNITGGLVVYNISNNLLTGDAFIDAAARMRT